MRDMEEEYCLTVVLMVRAGGGCRAAERQRLGGAGSECWFPLAWSPL